MSNPSEHHRIAASFGEPATARQAMVRLEQVGVDANAIDLVNALEQPTDADVGRADRRQAGWLRKRLGRGSIIGAVVAAAVLVGIVFVADLEPRAPIAVAAGVAGLAVGVLLGGFLWVGVNLPRNPDAWDTFLLDHRDEACVAVEVSDGGRAREIRELLLTAGADSVETFPMRAPRHRW